MKAGDLDYSDLLKLQTSFNEFAIDVDDLLKKMARKIAKALLNRTIKRTPVDTGNLQRNWRAHIHKEGHEYIIEVSNNTEYASYVEHGHRQAVGKYVPAIGKRLVSPFVEGKHMLKIAEDEVKRVAPHQLEAMLKKKLEAILDD